MLYRIAMVISLRIARKIVPLLPRAIIKKPSYLYLGGTSANALSLARTFLHLLYRILPCATPLLQRIACNTTHEQHCSSCMLSLIVLQIMPYRVYTG